MARQGNEFGDLFSDFTPENLRTKDLSAMITTFATLWGDEKSLRFSPDGQAYIKAQYKALDHLLDSAQSNAHMEQLLALPGISGESSHARPLIAKYQYKIVHLYKQSHPEPSAPPADMPVEKPASPSKDPMKAPEDEDFEMLQSGTPVDKGAQKLSTYATLKNLLGFIKSTAPAAPARSTQITQDAGKSPAASSGTNLIVQALQSTHSLSGSALKTAVPALLHDARSNPAIKENIKHYINTSTNSEFVDQLKNTLTPYSREPEVNKLIQACSARVDELNTAALHSEPPAYRR